MNSAQIKGWNLLLGVALAVLAGEAAWLSLAPRDLTTAASDRQTIHKETLRQSSAKAATAKALAAVQAKTWSVDAETLAGRALALLNTQTESHHLKLDNFRADRPTEAAGLREVPVTISVAGSFADVVDLLKSLETPDSALAPNLFQLSAAENAPGQVTATIGLVGFLSKEGS